MKIKGTNVNSKCLYCGSVQYGKGCPYGPNGLHVHTDDPSRCVWCGDTSVGKGCRYSPFNGMHQKGIAYNPIMTEAVENGIIQGIVMDRMTRSLTETPAFRAGLIDEHGNIIKEPKTIEEKRLLTGVDKYLIKVRNLVENRLDLLNASLYYDTVIEESMEDIERVYTAELEFRDDLQKSIAHLLEVVDIYSRRGITSSKAEKMIIEALLNEKKTENI